MATRMIQIEVPDGTDISEAVTVLMDAMNDFVDRRVGLYITDDSVNKYVSERYAGNPSLDTDDKRAEVKRRCLLARFMRSEYSITPIE